MRFSPIHSTAKSTSARWLIMESMLFPNGACRTWPVFSNASPTAGKSSPSTASVIYYAIPPILETAQSAAPTAPTISGSGQIYNPA